MPDPQPESPLSDLSAEIGASLASVWARYAGSRPTGAKIELDGSVVRWILPDGTSDLESGLNGDNEAPDAKPSGRTPMGYARETSAAVSNVTHRRVCARISKEDAKTGVATETFILEPIRTKN